MTTAQLFIGSVLRLGDEGQFSAIHKNRVNGPIVIGEEGLVGDAQADQRVHGGPEKAVHHYAAENYVHLASRFPAITAELIPGSIGENISTSGWDEQGVFIGDVFQLGSALLQVSQPRSPCWKIDHRYATKGLARLIAETGLTGWYYRVLEPGIAASGDPFELLARLPEAVSLAELWQVWAEHRPDLETLARLAVAPGLNPAWAKKLHDRLEWLRVNTNKQTVPVPTFHVKPTGQ